MDTQDPEFQCHIASALDDFDAGSKKCSGAPSLQRSPTTTVRQGAVKLEPPYDFAVNFVPAIAPTRALTKKHHRSCGLSDTTSLVSGS
jgi:hypothetical protein